MAAASLLRQKLAARSKAGLRFRGMLWVLVTILWFAAVGGGIAAMLRYEFVSGNDGGAPKLWPTASALPRAGGGPTLVVFAHPRCPCTEATMEELAEIMARTGGKAKVLVSFFTPPGASDEWTKSAVWRHAAAIPGVVIFKDENGNEAHLFDAATSGRTLLYGADGRLLFDGGITGSRGHVGENTGGDSVISLLSGEAPAITSTPVYGCQIFGECKVPKE